MKGDPRPPPVGLLRMQAEFGQSIRTPFSFSTGRFQCRKEAYSDRVAESITAVGGREGRDRLAVYNEQYWYRLLTVLQKDFPLLAGSMGLWTFNQMATAFLNHHPSRSPYLQDLPTRLVEFMLADPAYDSPRLVQIARLESSLLKAFHAPSIPSFDPSGLTVQELECLPQATLDFQPWFSLVEEDWNLMECRAALSEERKDPPQFLDRKGWWAVYRNGHSVEWMKLDHLQFDLLRRLESGRPLGAACEESADGPDPGYGADLSARISAWFATWTRLKWFGRPSFEGLVEGKAEMV